MCRAHNEPPISGISAQAATPKPAYLGVMAQIQTNARQRNIPAGAGHSLHQVRTAQLLASQEVRRRTAQLEAEEPPPSAYTYPVFSTAEAAQFFDRSTQWIYWGLRNDVFRDKNGEPIIPERTGAGTMARRRFTTPVLRAILFSIYRRGTITEDQLKRTLRRIHITELGGDWRQKEGWRLIRGKWIHPSKCKLVDGKWVRTTTNDDEHQ